MKGNNKTALILNAGQKTRGFKASYPGNNSKKPIQEIKALHLKTKN